MQKSKPSVLQRRNVRRVLTKDQLRGIKLVTLQKSPDEDSVMIYGSQLYQAQSHPSDLDLTQIFTICKEFGCNANTARSKIAIIIKEIVLQILNSNFAFLGDLKIGVDTEIEKIIWKIQNEIYPKHISQQYLDFLKKKKKKLTIRYSHEKLDENEVPQLLVNNQTVNYPKNDILKLWKNAYENGIINKDDFKKIEDLIPGKIKGKDGLAKFFTYLEFIRNLYLLRWTGNEVIVGVKYVNNREITLLKAIDSAVFRTCDHDEEFYGESSEQCKNIKTGKLRNVDLILHLIKIDMFAITDGKYYEYSNLLTLWYTDDKKYKSAISLGSFGAYTESTKNKLISRLLTDSASYYYEITKKYKKAMKYAKRMFVISLLKNDEKVANKIAKLFKSDINLLNSINSQLDVVISVLINFKNAPIEIAYEQLDQQKFRMSTITEFDINREDFYKIINEIISGKLERKDIIDILIKLKKHYSEMIDEKVKSFMKKENLWPGPYFSTTDLEFIYG
jgi:hypothetical protein